MDIILLQLNLSAIIYYYIIIIYYYIIIIYYYIIIILIQDVDYLCIFSYCRGCYARLMLCTSKENLKWRLFSTTEVTS